MLFTDGFLCSCCKCKHPVFIAFHIGLVTVLAKNGDGTTLSSREHARVMLLPVLVVEIAISYVGALRRYSDTKCPLLGIHIAYTPIHKSSFPRYMSGFET